MHVILADCAVSLIPESWLSNPKLKDQHKREKRLPVIDGSIHQHLLSSQSDRGRKDRPDILHMGLLTVQGYQGLIPKLDVSFQIGEIYYGLLAKTRLPRSQARFYGILSQLLQTPNSNDHIPEIPNFKMNEKDTIYFSSQGRPLKETDFLSSNFVFGGFAHGNYRSHSPSRSQCVSLSSQNLDLWTALSVFLNKYRVYKNYIN